jgi:pyruvate dehydrogenase E2 component (dihydrolipoyllysine-residue acetyltransferase)
MPTELKLPELGENFDTGVVNAILVKAGERVRKDQPVIEVETEKVTAEVPSTVEGVVKEIRVEEGAEIRVGQVILVIDAAGSATVAGTAPGPPPAAAGPAPALPAPPQAPRRAAMEPDPPPPSPEGTEPPARPEKPAAEITVPAAPAARRLARELGVEVRDIPGTEAGGRISLDDVKSYARRLIGGGPAAEAALPDFSRWGSVRREPMSGVRRKTGERTALSWATVPHVTQHDEADITELESLRRRWSARTESAGVKLTVTAIVLKAAAVALKVFPRFNASVDVARNEIILKDYVHIGVAVDAPHGLLVPVIRDAGSKNILQLASELAELSRKARARKLTLEEMEGSSFTVSNLGSLGTTHFSPIVNWPEAAILGVGRASTRAVYLDGSFLPRQILPLSVSYDHRVVDGAEAARFLRWIAEALEHPLKMVLEG